MLGGKGKFARVSGWGGCGCDEVEALLKERWQDGWLLESDVDAAAAVEHDDERELVVRDGDVDVVLAWDADVEGTMGNVNPYSDDFA